jgi:hypothetical protein
MNPDHYYKAAGTQMCSSTIAGWLWYCDVNDTHGNADSDEEALFIAKSHEMHKFMVDRDEGGCDLYVSEAGMFTVPE